MKNKKRICPNCRKIYKADSQRLKLGRQTTCSRKCSYELRAKAKRTAINFHCAVCQKDVCRSPSQLKSKHGSIFCSRECHYKGRSIGATKRIVTHPYTYTPEGKAAMIRSAKKLKGKRVWHLLTCLNCKKKFDDPSGGRKRKSGMTFCSLECCNAYRKGENNPSWRGGYPKYYGEDWRRMRKAARMRDDYSCKRCLKNMHPPSRLPDVHHIKPVSSFAIPNDANYLDNLVTLCHPCHMIVEWNGIDF